MDGCEPGCCDEYIGAENSGSAAPYRRVLVTRPWRELAGLPICGIKLSNSHIVMFPMYTCLTCIFRGIILKMFVIKTFADQNTKTFWETGKSPKWPPASLRKAARRKLAMIEAAKLLDDLKSPPGNRLHALEDDRDGQHAISINDQYRICFRWQNGAAHDVEITDYH